MVTEDSATDAAKGCSQGEEGPGGWSLVPALLHGLNMSAQGPLHLAPCPGLKPSEPFRGFPPVTQETNQFQTEMTQGDFLTFSSFAQVHSREALPSLIHSQYLFL